jgi:hypothetical protein
MDITNQRKADVICLEEVLSCTIEAKRLCSEQHEGYNTQPPPQFCGKDIWYPRLAASC